MCACVQRGGGGGCLNFSFEDRPVSKITIYSQRPQRSEKIRVLSPSFCLTATHDGGGHTAGHNGTTCFTVLEWRIADKPVRKYLPGVAGSILHW